MFGAITFFFCFLRLFLLDRAWLRQLGIAPASNSSRGATNAKEIRIMNQSKLLYFVHTAVSGVLLVALSACGSDSGDPGDAYVGTWQTVPELDTSIITIARDDDIFRFTREDVDKPNSMIFHLENGVLVFQNKNDDHGITFTYLEETDQMKFEPTGGATEFIKSQNHEVGMLFERR